MLRGPDIVELLREDFPYMRKDTVEKAFEVILETIVQGLEQEYTIKLLRFGTFSGRYKKASPSNIKYMKGKINEPKVTYRVVFKVGSLLRKRMQEELIASLHTD